MYRKRPRGSRFTPSAAEVNAFNDAARATKIPRQATPGWSDSSLWPTFTVKNTTGATRLAFDVVLIDPSALWRIGSGRGLRPILSTSGAGPDGGTAGEMYGVFQQSCRDGKAAPCVLIGQTSARCLTGTGGWAEPDGAYGLRPTTTPGQFKLLDSPDADGDLAPVLLGGSGGGGSPWRYFVLSSGLTGQPVATGTADLYDGEDETTLIESSQTVHFNANMFSDLVSGDCGTCLRANDGNWYCVNAPWQSGGPVFPSPTP